jgi:DNA-binding FadR family transcriptional regulator
MRLHREQMRLVFRAILAGEYEPGERLPSEEDLQRQLGVSRGVVREALRALEERGVVVVRHGSGQLVTEPSDWNVLDRELFAELVASRGGERLIAEVTECRLIAEVDVARLAATRATAGDHQRLGAAMEALRAAPARAERERGLADTE